MIWHSKTPAPESQGKRVISHTVTIGPFLIVVHRSWFRQDGPWYASCDGLFNRVEMSWDLETSKLGALVLLREVLELAMEALPEEATRGRSMQYRYQTEAKGGGNE